jgi:hypothetical protein
MTIRLQVALVFSILIVRGDTREHHRCFRLGDRVRAPRLQQKPNYERLNAKATGGVPRSLLDSTTWDRVQSCARVSTAAQFGTCGECTDRGHQEFSRLAPS